MRLPLPCLLAVALGACLPLLTAAAAPAPAPTTDSAAAPAVRQTPAGRASASGPATGSLSYRARVVHNNRSAISYVEGRIDCASGDFEEHVSGSYLLDWKQLPGRMQPAPVILPSIYSVDGQFAQQLGHTLPRFDSPLLRHFIIGQLLLRPESLVPEAQFLAGQLVVASADFGETGFEVVAAFRGAPLVLVGRRERVDGQLCVADLAVLGPASELYQYFFEQASYSAQALAPRPALPVLDTDKYIGFPADGAEPVAIRPVKDWLVFQATLPNGRPLNLVFDSAAEQMIVDDMVLKFDSRLEPSGEISVSGPVGDDAMQLYEGFAFNVGGVEFRNLSVAGTALTRLGFGAELRIHGVVGNEILQLCKLDIDLDSGELRLLPPGSRGPESAPSSAAQELPLTFIRELPHVEGAVQDGQRALLLLDTGQRSPLSVNLDYLEHYQLGDDLRMNGFLGDITGGLLPRYIIEELPLSLAGSTFTQKVVDAAPEYTFSYGGVPVAGAIGFSLLARHFGGITFDYSRKLLWLRNPGENRVFEGQVAAWDEPAVYTRLVVADDADDDTLADAAQAVVQAAPAGGSSRSTAPAPRQFGLDPYGYSSGDGHAGNPNTPERAAQLREEARLRKAERERAQQPDGEDETETAQDAAADETGEPDEEEVAQEPADAAEDEQPHEAAPVDTETVRPGPAFRLKPASRPLIR